MGIDLEGGDLGELGELAEDPTPEASGPDVDDWRLYRSAALRLN